MSEWETRPEFHHLFNKLYGTGGNYDSVSDDLRTVAYLIEYPILGLRIVDPAETCYPGPIRASLAVALQRATGYCLTHASVQLFS